MVIRPMEHMMYREVPVIRIPYNCLRKNRNMREANQPEFDLGDSPPFFIVLPLKIYTEKLDTADENLL